MVFGLKERLVDFLLLKNFDLRHLINMELVSQPLQQQPLGTLDSLLNAYQAWDDRCLMDLDFLPARKHV